MNLTKITPQEALQILRQEMVDYDNPNANQWLMFLDKKHKILYAVMSVQHDGSDAMLDAANKWKQNPNVEAFEITKEQFEKLRKFLVK